MAKNWWEDYKTEGAAPEVSPTTNWWDSYPTSEEITKSKKKEQIKPSNFISEYADKRIKSIEANAPAWMKDIKEKVENHPHKNIIEGTDKLAFDLVGSTLTQAVTGPGTLLSMAGQGAYGAGTTAKDIYSEKGLNFDKNDVVKILMSGGMSSMGPLIGRGLSPALPAKASGPPIAPMGTPKAKPEPVISLDPRMTAMRDKASRGARGDPRVQETEKMMNNAIAKMKAMKEAAQKKTVPETISKYVGKASESAIPAVAGALMGSHFAGSPFIGAALGAATPHVKNYALSKMPQWWANSMMHDPAKAMMLNALLRETGGQVGNMIDLE